MCNTKRFKDVIMLAHEKQKRTEFVDDGAQQEHASSQNKRQACDAQMQPLSRPALAVAHEQASSAQQGATGTWAASAHGAPDLRHTGLPASQRACPNSLVCLPFSKTCVLIGHCGPAQSATWYGPRTRTQCCRASAVRRPDVDPSSAA